jgi:hypothetical protein
VDPVGGQPLFRRLLGDAFDALPDAVRALHDLAPGRHGTWRGEATIVRGKGLPARLCAAATRLPPAGSRVPTTVAFAADGRGETWRRDFGGAVMATRCRGRDGLLLERLGPVEFAYSLRAGDGTIRWTVRRARLFGLLPLPAAWFSGVRCREREHAGRYEFQVEAALPRVGALVRYEGWLERA